MRLLTFIAVLGYVGLVTATLGVAQDKAAQGLHGPFVTGEEPAAFREFMHAAIDACAEHAAGDACTMIHGDKTLDGRCRQGQREGMPLMCRPQFEPPQLAIDACANHADGDACSVTLHDHQLAGTCHSRRDGSGPLACRPHPAAPSQEAVDACTDLSTGDECTISIDGSDVSGRCHKGHTIDAPLACFAPRKHHGFEMRGRDDDARKDEHRGRVDDDPHDQSQHERAAH